MLHSYTKSVSLFGFVFLPLSFIVILGFVDSTSIFSYCYTLLLFFILNKVVCKKYTSNYFYFHLYLFVAIVLFVVHRYNLPQYLGLTGPENGIGTDDCRFYAQLKNGQVPYAIRFVFENTFAFTTFLKFLYPFPINTPLNIIIVNLLGVTFLAYFVKRLSFLLTKSDDVSSCAEKLILFCPFIMYYGCIIMRDMWTTTCVIAGLCYYLERKKVNLIICVFLIVYLRFGSIVFLVVGILIFMRERLYNLCSSRLKGRILVLCCLVGGIIAFQILYPYLQAISGGKLEDGLFRASFYEKLMNMDSDALILSLMNLPFPLNTISLTVFFFFLPFFNSSLYTMGLFSMQRLFCTFSTPLLFFFLWKYIIQVILQNILHRYNDSIRSVIYIAIAFSMALGTVSLQARHKTVLFPILCMLAAYGICNNSKKYSRISIIASVFIIVVQLYMAF